MKYTLLTMAAILFFVSLVSFVVYLEISFWNECRETNSFWYCLRVLNR